MARLPGFSAEETDILVRKVKMREHVVYGSSIVPPKPIEMKAGEWNNTLGRTRGSSEIPCRRMRSGSYVKAMGDQENSEDSEGSPKPSPKMAGRRQSYLKATQQSLSEQLPLRNCLPSLQELSTNRSLDNLDCISGPPSATFPNWDEEDFSLGCNTLGKIGCVTKMQVPEVGQTAVDTYQDSPFGEGSMQPATEAVELPSATCFRSRSHSYLRAIQAGCSQDEDTGSLDSDSPPPTATTVRTYSSSTTSTCITTCKRTPPPVPPRIAAKPFISVTVQSSTESAHDTYLENQERRTEAPPSASRPVPSYPPDGPERVYATQPSPCTTQQEPPTPSSPPKESQHDTAQSPPDTLTPKEPQAELGPKRKLSSIGIQVDCLLPVQKEETPPLTRFQSIGVQVEDSWQLNRSSSMASKPEADCDIQDDPKPADKGVADSATQPESEPAPNTQGNSEGGTGCQVSSSAPSSSSSSSSESLDPALDPSSLPPPDPWLESVTSNGGSVPTGETPPVGAPTCRRDGHWFLKLLQAETARMEGWCQQMEQETKDHQLSEEVLGRVRSAIGSAQLLMSQKFQQFRGLCDQNLNVDANPRPTAQDLAGFWDLLQLSIEDISMKFDELYHLKSNDWQLSDSPDKKEDKKQPPPVPKKPSKAKLAANREKGSVGGGSGGSSDPADKQRQEARKRLMAAKRAASVRQNSATESADSIEIYVPEAQTRL
ncbi:disks large-associated protein 4-like isoform X2 [Paramormyrops kingsleyae]|uniref:disks large-associated protein 4-like isoform X2 n=1 Tax=Paramormyrops kingsleyae TaxID=1676925 RepID=UPI003B972C1D